MLLLLVVVVDDHVLRPGEADDAVDYDQLPVIAQIGSAPVTAEWLQRQHRLVVGPIAANRWRVSLRFGYMNWARGRTAPHRHTRWQARSRASKTGAVASSWTRMKNSMCT